MRPPAPGRLVIHRPTAVPWTRLNAAGTRCSDFVEREGSTRRRRELFNENEQIVLTAALTGDEGEELKPGDVGTVIHIHPGQAALVVEFISIDGSAVAIATVLPSQARPATGAGPAHAATPPAAL